MGVVFVAYDEELERRLAVKLLLPGLASGRHSQGEVRLLREAQALARVSHPNVVQVYEVGTTPEGVYIAMELVRGKPLGEWLAAAPRRWREIVAVFRQAGAGLCAAHAAGVVHRDVKPDNLLVGDDGRVRVLDFSLARPPERAAGDATEDTADIVRTRAGALIGTPMYMSPEQLLGEPADARSDQFSFCVALFEALFGVRPFAGATVDALRKSVVLGDVQASRGRSQRRSQRVDERVSRRTGDGDAVANGEVAAQLPADAASGTAVPAWLRRVLLRGLRVDPAARYPDMQALLRELARDPYRGWRRAALGAGIVALLAAGSVAGMQAVETRAQLCSGGAAHLIGVWDPDRREAAERAVLATGVPFAASTWVHVAGVLDAHAEGWVARRNAACAASHLRGDQSLALLERRNACLDARLRELDALARVLSEARPETVERAVQAAANLRSLASCDDDAALLAGVPVPEDPSRAAAVDALRRRLARAEALERSGDLQGALREVGVAQAAARELGDAPLIAEAAYARGHVALGLTRLPEAIEQLEAAYHAAQRMRHEEVSLMAAVDLVAAHRGLAHLDVAELWVGLAGDALARAGDPPALTANLLQLRANLASDRGRPAEALALAQEALSLRQGPEGQVHPDIPQSYNAVGLALHALGRDDEALAAYDEGLTQAGAILGAEHPGVVPLLNNRATLLADRGEFAAALAAYRRGLEIRVAVYGTGHPRYAFSLAQIGDLLVRQGKYGEAAPYLEQALEIRTRALGPDHPEVGDTLTTLGKLEFLRGHSEAAMRATQRALVVLSGALGPDHVRVSRVKQNLAAMYRAQGHLAQALAVNAELRAQLEASLPPGHKHLLAVRGNQANVLRELGRHGEAIAELREVLALEEAAQAPPGELARTLLNLGIAQLAGGAAAEAVVTAERGLSLAARAEDHEFTREKLELALAQALWARGADRPRARKLAEASAAALRRAGPDAESQLREVEAWLAKL